MIRIRIIFSKQGALRYTGHLDLHRLWERAMRRADLPLSYSQGFHPQPKISLAAALPLGFSSQAEALDVRLNEEIPSGEITARLRESLPPDIQVLSVERVDERLPALQTQVVSALYRVELSEPADAANLKQKAIELLASPTVARERRGKFYDLRPLIDMLEVEQDLEGEVTIKMKLSAREGATGRPEEVLLALGIEPEQARVERTKLIFIEPGG